MLAGAGIAGDRTAGQPTSTGARPWPVPGWRRRWRPYASPDGLARVDPGQSFQGTLRPYQQAGVQWLYLLTQLRLGACLADDMGLGKTIQVLSLLLVLKNEDRGQAETVPSRSPRLAARQLGRRDCPICAKPQSDRGPSIGCAGRETEHGRCGQSGRCRSRHHELRLSDAYALARNYIMAVGGA